MSKLSTLIGEVIDGTPKLHHTTDGENFYTISVRFLDATIDVLFSEFIKQDSYEDKISVTGYLASEPRRGAKPYFYFYGSKIESVAIDTPITNEIEFTCKVTKVGDFKVNKRAVEVLPLIASDYTTNHTTSVLYLCVRGRDARRLYNREKGYYLSGRGYLKQYRDVYEVRVVEIYEDNDEA